MRNVKGINLYSIKKLEEVKSNSCESRDVIVCAVWVLYSIICTIPLMM